MADAFWVDSDDQILVDGSDQPIDCPSCPCHLTDCNSAGIPPEIPLVFTFLCIQFTVTLHWHASSGDGPSWTYDDLVDIDICDGLRFRGFVLLCSGSSWVTNFIYTVRNGAGVYIQQVVTTGSGMTGVVTVSTDPLCVTTTSPGLDSSLGTDCGPGTAYFAVGSGCNVIPPCCDWGSLPSTATLAYTLGALSLATKGLSNIGSGYASDSSFTCAVGDGTRLDFTFGAVCDSSIGRTCRWSISFQMLHVQISPAVILKAMAWQLANITAGTVRSEDVAFSCSPFHAHLTILNTGGPATTSTVTCGGVTYPFGPAGTINAVLDAVTP